MKARTARSEVKSTTCKNHGDADEDNDSQDEENTQQHVSNGHHNRLEIVLVGRSRLGRLKFQPANSTFASVAGIDKNNVLLAAWTKSHWPVHNNSGGDVAIVTQHEQVVTSFPACSVCALCAKSDRVDSRVGAGVTPLLLYCLARMH